MAKSKFFICRYVSVGGNVARDWSRSANFASAAEAKNRKRNSSYEQSSSSLDGGGAGKDSKGDFMSRPSPGEALLSFILTQ